MVITEVTEAFDPDCRFSLVQDAIATGGVVLGIKLEDAGSVMTTKPTKDLQAEAKSIDEKGVLVAHVRENGSWHSSMAKHLSEAEQRQINESFDAKEVCGIAACQ